MSLKCRVRNISFTIIISLFLLCCSCSANRVIEPGSQAYAYLEVFKNMTSDIMKHETKYLGVNLKNVLFTQPAHIKKLIDDYVKKYDVSVIWNDNEREYNSFKKGYLIIFKDVELTETKLSTEMTWMGGPLYASGFNYTVEKKKDEWFITNFEPTWIS